ncbi:MAG: hypothetical protein K2I69_02365 [Muribaculaceae bacterium]|nr:hypothetical protein [Muribaculaceae bacterium]
MKKLIQLISIAALTAAPAAMAQNLSVEGVEGSFSTFQEAFNAIESEGTITVLQDFTATPAKTANNTNENAALLVGEKNITIKGEGHTVDFATFFVFNLQNVNGSLTAENITLNYTGGETASARGVINVSRGSINLADVTVTNANVASSFSIISLNNSNSNIPSAVLNGVKLENCTTSSAAEVLLANNNLTIEGDCSFSLYVNNSTSAFTPAAGSDVSGNVTLSFATTEVGNTAVRNSTATDVFTLNDENYILESDGTNLVIAEKTVEPVYPVYIGDTGYDTLNAAITAVEDGGEATIEIKEDITLTSNLSRTAGKTIIVNGNGFTINRGEVGARFIAVTNTATTSLTFNDVTFDGNNTELTVASFQPSSSAALYLNNVTFENFITSNARGIVDATAGGTWHISGVKFTNCEVPNQYVTTNASAGCSISGDNSLSLRINGDTTVDAEGIANTTPVSVTLGTTPTVGQTVFTNCSDADQFECANSNFTFAADNGNLVIANATLVSVGQINAETEGNTVYYNMQGNEVASDRLFPGIYIAVKNGASTKVIIK